MAFQPNINEINSKYTKKLQNHRITTKITINCTDKSIGQVLSVGAKPKVVNLLPASGSVMIEASSLAKAVIVDRDNNYFSLEENINFSQPIINNEITPDSSIFANLSVVDTSNIQASEHHISFDITLNVTLYAVLEQHIQTVESLGKNAYERTTSIPYSNLVFYGSDEFELTNEVELPTNIGAVVQVQSDTLLQNVETGEGIITLSAKVINNLIYLTNEDTPRLKTQKYTINFNQEINCPNASTLDNSMAILQDCGTNYEVQGELSSVKGVLLLKNSYSVISFINRVQSADVVCDAFCPKYQLLPTNSSFIVQKSSHIQTFNDKIDGNIILADNSARIDRVLATTSSTIDYNIDVTDNLRVLGTVFTNVIYELDNDEHTIGSVLAEIPFNIQLPISDTPNFDDLSVNVIVTDIEARNKRSLEIDIIADLAISVNIASSDTGVVISNFELGEALPTKYPPMGIYYINNADTEWDVAKTLLVSPELIISQNPNLEFPINKPTPILLYRGRNTDNQ